MAEDKRIDRIYTLRFHRIKRTPRTKRAAKAVRYLRRFMQQHMKAERVVIQQEVNEALWRRGIQNPPARLRVRAEKREGDTVVVSLAE
ncbi:MAG: 50S ribosomal protein L31e [Euryarchaeota archaeon]|nr:50S ribosomal protein L31e [Euryarchaeota archaeon]